MNISKAKKTWIIFGVGILLILCISYFALKKDNSQSVATSEIVLRLGYRPTALADITPVIIKEKGLGTNQFLKIELVPVANPQIALQKYDAGEVDALAGIPLEAIIQRMVNQGDPGFKAYYLQMDLKGEGWVSIVSNKRINPQSVKDLAGKTIASLPTEQAQYLLRRILKAAGIPDSEIKIVTYNPTTPLVGLESGEHDAIFGLEPAISRATSQGHRVLARGPVSEYLYDGKPVPVSASVIRKDFANRYPQEVERFLGIIDQAVEIQNSDSSTVRNYFLKADYGELKQDVVQNLFLPIMQKPTPEIKPTLELFFNDLFTNGIIKTQINSNLLLN